MHGANLRQISLLNHERLGINGHTSVAPGDADALLVPWGGQRWRVANSLPPQWVIPGVTEARCGVLPSEGLICCPSEARKSAPSRVLMTPR